MSVIIWNDEYSVMIEEIDSQHKRLVNIINTLYDAIREEKGKDVLSEILSELIDYTLTHFRTEEKYFKKFSYSESEEHIEEHEKFVKKISDFKSSFMKNEKELDLEILNFLGDWLTHHIKGTDKKYSKFFNENGLF